MPARLDFCERFCRQRLFPRYVNLVLSSPSRNHPVALPHNSREVVCALDKHNWPWGRTGPVRHDADRVPFEQLLLLQKQLIMADPGLCRLPL